MDSLEEKWMEKQDLLDEKAEIENAGRLHWYHWLVVIASLLLTIGASYYATLQSNEKVALQFDREAERAVALVEERMIRYEVALWSGVANIQALDHAVELEEWQAFSESLHIDDRYPGINGIGVIHHLLPKDVDEYLQQQRRSRPDFRIHPIHSKQEYLPITFIEPVSINASAIGLDVAHESNRYKAARKARDSGRAQITAPIVLVQDAEQTPGFLFYAPYYKTTDLTSKAERQAAFTGLVYAPFVFKKLMEGALGRSQRRVSIDIRDTQEVLFSEHKTSDTDFDPKALYKRQFEVPMFGRMWKFNIWSDLSFRNAADHSQPIFILIGGLIIDALLLSLFVLISKSNKRAVEFAARMSESYQSKAEELEEAVTVLAESNKELDQFAYIASHDLQEPLRMISSFTQLIEEEYADKFDEQGTEYLSYVTSSAKRMQVMIRDLLDYTHPDALGIIPLETNMEDLVTTVRQDILGDFEDSEALLEVGFLPKVTVNPAQLSRVLQNLISNGIKYRHPDRTPVVKISSIEKPDEWVIEIKDNGIGIKEEYLEQIFTIFKRLHTAKEFPGTGLGLAICRKVILGMNGRIGVKSEFGVGSTFYFSIPKTASNYPVLPGSTTTLNQNDSMALTTS